MNFVDLAAIIGISSVVSAVVSYILDTLKKRQETKFASVFQEKYRRYNHLLAHMMLIIDPLSLQGITILEKEVKEKYKILLAEKGEQGLQEYLLHELSIYSNFYCLFASSKVVKMIDVFEREPSNVNYKKVAYAMRADLWK